MRRATLVLALLAAGVQPAVAYLKLGFEAAGGFVLLRWPRMPVRYHVSETSVPGVGPAELQAAASRAAATWEAVASSSIRFEFGGFTAIPPGEDDGRSTLGFLFSPEPDVLAATSFLVDLDTGELLESDIFFNSAFPWSVAGAGEAGRFDLETIAVHEIGHLIGLGHSALGETEIGAGGRRVVAMESVMFPIAFGPGNIANRRLRADDIAGISDLYAEPGFRDQTGSISGRVTKNGRGVLGAHVVAFSPRTGALVGNFSLNREGEFAIAGLTPGGHLLRIEPLDDGDLESFFEETAAIDLDFRASFHRRIAVAPRGGDGAVQIEVSGK